MDLDKVKSAKRNPKTHDVEAIKASYVRFSAQDSPVLDERTKRLLSGHGRIEALQALRDAGEKPPNGIQVKDGRWLVPIQRGGRTKNDAEAEAYLVAANRLTESGGWDDEALAEILGGMEDFDGVGWSEDDPELAELLGEDEEEDEEEEPEDTDDDEIPTVDRPSFNEGEVRQVGNHTIACSDCVSYLRTLPSNSIDAIVTDPPYGMSSRTKQVAAVQKIRHAFSDIQFPKLYEFDSKSSKSCDLPEVSIAGPDLGSIDGSIGIDSDVGMPESSVDLNNSPISEEEVNTGEEPPSVGVADGNLSSMRNSSPGEFLGDFIFEAGNSSRGLRNVLGGCAPELFFGGFAVPISAVATPGLPGLSRGCFPVVIGGKDVGLVHHPLGESKTPSPVVTLPGTINRLMLRFDSRGTPVELVATSSAPDVGSIGQLGGPQLVRACSAASRLSSMAKPCRIGFVVRKANGALTNHWFNLWLPKKSNIVVKLPSGGFMGKAWDATLPNPEVWRQAMRVLKPGGHVIAFSATRTMGRLSTDIEDSGFEIRDTISWLYWQGFPKSLDLSKAIDKMKHNLSEVLEVTAWIKKARDAAGVKNTDIDKAFGFAGMAGHWTTQKTQPTVPTLDQVPVLLNVLGVTDPPKRIQSLLLDLNSQKGEPGKNWWKRKVIGKKEGTDLTKQTIAASVASQGRTKTAKKTFDITASASELAEKWEGWGTALKPAMEPAVLARKPFIGTVANNVIEHGTGAINIEDCRMPYGDPCWPGPNDTLDIDEADTGKMSGKGSGAGSEIYGLRGGFRNASSDNGRWPANIFVCPKPAQSEKSAGLESYGKTAANEVTGRKKGAAGAKHARSGKTGDSANFHPTVKPVRLMRWLIRLVTPPGGVVMDTFLGSGTTMVAAEREGFRCIGVEMSGEFASLSEARVQQAIKPE